LSALEAGELEIHMTLMSAHRAASLTDHRAAGSVGHRRANAVDLQDAARGDGTKIEELPNGLFRVMTAGRIRGFVEEVGTVYVSLRGQSYDRAVEVHQGLIFAQAVRALVSP
jgi:hypothetical protein